MPDNVLHDYGKFRVVTRRPATEYGDTVFVQCREPGGWRDLRSFNALSDDYAYTNARDDAEQRARQDARPEAPRESA